VRGGWPRTGDTRLPDAYQPTMPVMVNTIFSLLCEQQIPAETIQCVRKRHGAARAWLASQLFNYFQCGNYLLLVIKP